MKCGVQKSVPVSKDRIYLNYFLLLLFLNKNLDMSVETMREEKMKVAMFEMIFTG